MVERTVYCQKHYQRNRKYGSPLAGGPEKLGTLGLFRKYVTLDDNCWLWTGPTDGHGYGRAGRVRAHRFSYELLVGPIPDGLVLDHLCRVPLCVRPDHLEPVTDGENTRRGVAAQRRTERALAAVTCSKGHAWTEDNIYWRGEPKRRMCRACQLGRSQRQYDRLKAQVA